MLQPGASPYLPPTLAHSEHNTILNLERLCSVTGISRAMIAGLLGQAHGPWLLHLGPRERLAVLETMAGIYACLGYKRKEAYILREVLGCVMDLLVCGREENRSTPRSSPGTGVAGLGIRGVSFGDRSTGAEQGSVGVRHNDYVEGNDSILSVLKYVCRVLGINLEAVKLVDAHFDGDTNESDSSPNSVPPIHPDDDALESSHDAYGWPELQIGVIREAIAVAESLPGPLISACSNARSYLLSNRQTTPLLPKLPCQH
jgi:trafficking protein particle complex subunit 9